MAEDLNPQTFEELVLACDDDAPAAAEALGTAALEPLERLIHHRNPEIRRSAVRCLGALVKEGAAPSLLRATEDPDPNVRRDALLWLRSAPTAAPAPELLAVLRRHPDAAVRRELALLAGHLGAERVAQELESILEQESDAEVRRSLDLALARLGDRSRREALLAGLSSTSTEERLQALEAFEYISAPQESGRLSAWLDDETTAEVIALGPQYVELRFCDLAARAIVNVAGLNAPFDAARPVPLSAEQVAWVKENMPGTDSGSGAQ